MTAGTSEIASTEESGSEGGGLSLGSVFLSFHVKILYIYIYIKIQHLHSFSVDRHRSFHVLTIVNNDAMDIGVHVSFQISRDFFLDMHPGVRLLDHMMVLILVF